ALNTTFLSSQLLNVLVPTSALATAGPQQLKVTNPSGMLSNSVNLTVLERGDVNSNRTVNIADALTTALTLADTTKPQLPISVGDTNLSGIVNIGDALTVALFAGHLNPNLPMPVITSVSPSPATRGGNLIINGTGFGLDPASYQILFTTINDGVVRVTP